MKVIFFILLSILLLGCMEKKTIEIQQKPPTEKISNLVRKVPIALSDVGYQNFETQLFSHRETLDHFLSTIKTEKNWQKKENFLESIEVASMDFEKENLLIYRFDEQKGSIVLAVDVPTELNKHLFVHIGKEKPKREVSKEYIPYAVAYIVNKSIVDITFNDNDTNITIPNKEELE